MIAIYQSEWPMINRTIKAFKEFTPGYEIEVVQVTEGQWPKYDCKIWKSGSLYERITNDAVCLCEMIRQLMPELS